jgi:hypothetical protein
VNAKRVIMAAGLAVMLLAGCGGDPTQVALYSTQPAEQLARRLATVEIPPTLDEAAQRATQIAGRATATLPATPLPTPTVYIGIFIPAEDNNLPPLQPFDGSAAQPTPLSTGVGGVPTAVGLPANNCPIPPDSIFGAQWATSDVMLGTASGAIGCPFEVALQVVGSSQVFENGVMYFIPNGDIWAIAPGGTAGGQYWHVSAAPPEQSWEVPVPEGLRLPRLGFGAVWRAVDGVRQTLGFATTDEANASLTIQRFTNGALIYDASAGRVFALVGTPDNGTVYGAFGT